MQGFDLSTISDAYVGGTNVSAIYLSKYDGIGYDMVKLIWPLTAPSEYANNYFTIESLEDNNEISFGWYDTYASEQRELFFAPTANPTSLDWGAIRREYDNNQRVIRVLNKGEVLIFRGNYADWNRTGSVGSHSYSSGARLNSSKKVKIYGNLASLIENKPVIKTAKSGIRFIEFFKGLDIVDASNLYINMKLYSYAFQKAFEGRISMIYAPSILYPNKINDYCYYGMFQNCTALRYPPILLPSKQLWRGCYAYMFNGCTALTIAPELPAIQLAQNCYEGMFKNCVSLVNAPALPSTKLESACYASMFEGCTSLTESPILMINSIGTTSNRPCELMFSGCTSLCKITCLYDEQLITNNGYSGGYSGIFRNWADNVASTGTFIKRSGTNWPTGNSGIPYGWTIEDSKITVPLTIKSNQNNNEIYITNTTNEFTYSLDEGQTWQILQPNVHITLNNGDRMQLMAANRLNGNKPTVDSTYGIGNIKATDIVYVYGNVMSLLDGSYNNAGYYNFETMQEIPHNYQFKGLFVNNNVNIRVLNTLSLPATKLKKYCYQNMFTGNYNIQSGHPIVNLPAVRLEEGCYSGMFAWTNIDTPPELPALVLAANCYNGMFWGCQNITTPPTLPATQLKDSCYAYMFAGSAITTPPTLPATELADYCYQYMLGDCTSLTSAPILPATELSPVCYASMFEGCTSLTTAPTLSATQLAWGCYRQMFKNCSSLNSIKCLALDLGYSDWVTTKDWVDGVAASGTFTKAATMQNWTTGIDGIPSGWTVDTETPPYFTITSLANNNNISYQSNVNNTFSYSIDNGTNWVTWSPNSTVTLNNGDKLLIKGTNPTVDQTYGIVTFNATNYFNVSGNIMSLVDGDNYATSTTINAYQFRKLFNGNSYIVNAQNLVLPIITLAHECYEEMFSGCTSLVTAPALPATILTGNCYDSMFSGCSSLVTAPTLPATTLADSCYAYMFNGCSSLVTAPALPATTAADKCYYSMFSGCTSLTTAPQLPITTFDNGSYPEYSECYRFMFTGCTSLTTAPVLPATVLGYNSYDSMFYGCSSLTTVTEISAPTLRGCNYMFYGCSSLNYIKCLATNVTLGQTDNWVYGVSATGTFVKDASMQNWPSGVNGIPSGWTVQDAS